MVVSSRVGFFESIDPWGPSWSNPSTSRHLRPSQVLVDAWLTGQAEDPFTHDVAQDLGGAALDGVGSGPQEHLARIAPAGERSLFRAHHLVAIGKEGPLRTEDRDAELVDPLVHLGERELGDRALGAGDPRLAVRGGAGVGEPEDLGL